MACGGIIFTKNSKFIEKKIHFYLLHLISSCYYCSRDLKSPSEQSGLRPDTSSPVSVLISVTSRQLIFLISSVGPNFLQFSIAFVCLLTNLNTRLSKNCYLTRIDGPRKGWLD